MGIANRIKALANWIRLRGPLTKAVIGAIVLALIGTAVWVGYTTWVSCGQGVEKRGEDDECTGVTDGSFSFAPTLAQVSSRIEAENARIAGRPHATIAMMIPMTSKDPVEKTQALREVQGAYLAQYRANRDNDQAPAIRLVLANPGRNSAQWHPVADQLVGMAESAEDNLRAVVGFDKSVRSTEQTIRYLTNTKGVPVVGGPITADDIAPSAKQPDAFKGLAKVVPSTSDQAAALANFENGVDPRRTLIVEDTREDDNYIRSLRRAFARLTEGAPHAPEQFVSPPDVNSESTTSNDFRQMVNTICNSPATRIYFAGRPVQLRQFVNELGKRACTGREYTVVTGSHGSALASDDKLHWSALDAGVTVEYASIAHPDAWTRRDAPSTGGSKADFEALRVLAEDKAKSGPVGPIGPVDLTDFRTITAHDSAWTAITAIRSRVTAGSPVPPLEEIPKAWPRLHGDGKVRGASGWICLDNYGKPYDKAVSIVRLQSKAPHTQFAGLAWPEGKPPAEDCTAPRGG